MSTISGLTGVFVTGTDTGVGKTTVATGLALGFQQLGLRALPMKPVQTGCVAGRAPDLDAVLAATGLPFRPEMLPYGFPDPCSPHLAAARAGQRIELAPILDAFHALRADADLVVVEGAGGLLVPLNEGETMLDLMRALRLPAVLASRPGLGTINHTLLSLRALREAGIETAGWVTVDTSPSDWTYIEEDNLKTVIELGRAVHLGHIPHLGDSPLDGDRLRTVCHTMAESILDSLNQRG